MNDDLQLERFRLTSIQFFAIAGMIIVGLLLLVSYAGMTDKTTFWPVLISQISSALLIGGIWTGFYELLQKRDFIRIQNRSVERIVDKIPDVDHFGAVGLYRTESQLGSNRYRQMIDSSDELTIVINDGRTWVSNHIANLESRFEDESKKTTFIFLHPDSTFIPNLVEKLGTSVDRYQAKIRETAELLKDHSCGMKNLEILGHLYHNPHSTFMTESEIIVTPYYYSRSRKVPPAFFYRNSGGECYFRKLNDDIQALRLDCKPIVTGGATPSGTKNGLSKQVAKTANARG